MGNNPEAARLSGINTSTLLLGVYTVAGLFYGIAALLLVGRTNVGDPNAGQTENLASITAVVLGGTSLFGGRGSAWSALLGIIVIQSIANGLTLLNLSSSLRYMITGGVLAIAVIVDSLARQSRVSHGRA